MNFSAGTAHDPCMKTEEAVITKEMRLGTGNRADIKVLRGAVKLRKSLEIVIL